MQTPYFLIDQKRLEELTEEMFSALREQWPQGILGYSFKTNNLPWLLTYMKGKGAWAEVVSSDEYSLAKKLGFSHIIFNGPVKGEKEFKEAVESGCIVNVDSKRELRWLAQCSLDRANIGLRVNFDLEKLCPGQTQCGEEDGRFGFSLERGEFREALAFLRAHDIALAGVHLHCSSRTRSRDIYEAIARTAVELVREYELELSYVDIGGGFFGGVPGKPTFREYFQSVKAIFDTEPRLRQVNVIVEPGMSLIGASVEYHTTVVDVKKTPHNRFVLTDGSRIHIDPLMTKRSYAHRIEPSGGQRQPEQKQTLCGFTCMENDRFFTITQGPALEEGDRVVFEKVGAYTMVLSPLFIQFFPAVYVKDRYGIRQVREKWTAEHMLFQE